MYKNHQLKPLLFKGLVCSKEVPDASGMTVDVLMFQRASRCLGNDCGCIKRSKELPDASAITVDVLNEQQYT